LLQVHVQIPFRSANGELWLKPRQPSRAAFDEPNIHAEQDDAVSINVVNDGVADGYIPNSVVARAAAHHDSRPLRRVVRGNSVDDDVLDRQAGRSPDRDQARAFRFRRPGYIPDNEILQPEVPQRSFGAADENP
jgi:hypothetical protein